MAHGGTGILTAQATPETARRAWPRWLALGLAMVALAVVAVLWGLGGARLLLGALGLFLVLRGVWLLRAGRSRTPDRSLARQARSVGTAALGWGGVVLLVAIASADLAAAVLLFAVPAGLLAAGGILLGRASRAARRGGAALLVWAVLVTGMLGLTLVGQGWDRAFEVATVVTALVVAGLGVSLLVAALRLRTIAARPGPAVRAACAGCACGAGGCGS